MGDDPTSSTGLTSPFDDPEHSEVLVSRAIIERGAQIRHVMRHENGEYGYYTGDAWGFRDVVRVHLVDVLRQDSNVYTIRFLDPGETATWLGDRWMFSGGKRHEKESAGSSGCMLFFVAIALVAALIGLFVGCS